MELRERVVAAVDKGLGKAVVAETFGPTFRSLFVEVWIILSALLALVRMR